MKSKITLSILSVLLTLFLGAQQDVTFTVTDGGSGDAIEGATVTLDGQQQTTDIAGESVFNGIADGGYAYTVTSPCFEDYSGTINVAGAPLGEAVTLTAKTVNNVNIFVNSGGAAVGGAELNFDDGNGNSFDITSQPFGSGTMTNDVPYGTYNYTATVDCYTIAAGTFVVDCNTEATVEVNVEALPTTTHNAEISIGNPTYEGANVRIRNFATGFDQTYVSGATPEIVSDLAYGNYSISVEQACYETVYHNFTIDCNSDANMVIETPTFEPKVDNDVRFYVQEKIYDDFCKKFVENTKKMEALQAEDIANAIHYAVDSPNYVNVNEILIRPTTQER